MPEAGGESSLMASNQAICAEVSTSSLFTMIPSAVRSRIPVLTSIRRSAKAVVLHHTPMARRKAYTLSGSDHGKEMDGMGFASTVPNSGVSTPTIRPQTPDGELMSAEIGMRMLPQPESQSGVNWDVAATGIRLWVTAKTQADQGGDPAALRSMHIDALRYMHMALPPDLSALEIESLRASMSPDLFYQTPPHREYRPQGPPSVLRRAVAQIVCWCFATFLLIMPIVMTLLNRILQYERQHQVTERLLSNGLNLSSALGERGLELQKAIVRFKGGPVGVACTSTGTWFVEGIIGGVNDGIDAVAQSRAKAAQGVTTVVGG